MAFSRIASGRFASGSPGRFSRVGQLVDISAVICTHDRPDLLRRAITSLTTQTLAAERYEIIIVDNAPGSAAARAVVDSFADATNLVYVVEPELGISRARNAGWRRATAPYVAYLDDDATAAADWLERILAAFASATQKLGIVGGKVLADWAAPRPPWLADELTGLLSIADWGSQPFLLDEDHFIVGANMAIPRDHLERFGGFPEALGRKGTNLLSNDEIMIHFQLRAAGFAVLYDPSIKVWHRIAASRLEKRWFIRRELWQGISNAVLELQMAPHSRRQCIGLGLDALRALLARPGRAVQLILPAVSRRQLVGKCRAYRDVGYIVGMLAGARRH